MICIKTLSGCFNGPGPSAVSIGPGTVSGRTWRISAPGPRSQAPVRVVRSQERYTQRCQLTQQHLTLTTEWIWVTTLAPIQACTERVVRLGHQRWDIENYGFNEIVTEWNCDHVYRHQPNAMVAFLLTAFLAYNLFHAFLLLNLKLQRRHSKPERFWARLIAADLYTSTGLSGTDFSP